MNLFCDICRLCWVFRRGDPRYQTGQYNKWSLNVPRTIFPFSFPVFGFVFRIAFLSSFDETLQTFCILWNAECPLINHRGRGVGDEGILGVFGIFLFCFGYCSLPFPKTQSHAKSFLNVTYHLLSRRCILYPDTEQNVWLMWKLCRNP